MNKRYLVIILVFIILINVSFIFCKSYFSGVKIGNTKKNNKSISEILLNKINYNKNIIQNHEFQKCMNKSFDENNFSKELKTKKEKIISLYDDLDANFMYTDLIYDYSFGKDINEESYAASVTKLPLAIYIYKEADKGNIDLNKEITFLSKYKVSGSGVLKETDYGKKYKIKTVLEYVIKFSDNAGYDMLLDEIGGTDKVKNYFSKIGYEIKYYDNFGDITPSLGNGYIKEVYKYYLSGSKNAKKLVDDMINSDNSKYVKTGDVLVAHKYGEYVEGGGYYNDVSLNFTDYPFALSITSTLGYSDEMENLFKKSHELSISFNELYHTEKYNYCKGKAHILN